MGNSRSTYRQGAADVTAAAVVVGCAVLLSLFAIRNNDIWWLMAVGRRLVETRSFITRDPFTFTAPGAPWAPQAYLASLLMYGVHQVSSATGLIVLRAILVGGIFVLLLRAIARVSVSWLAASPVTLLVLLTTNTRFILRAHLFEYLFLAGLLVFLLGAHERRGKSFYVLPVILQLLWVNTHPSFALGPLLVALYLGCEGIAHRLPNVHPIAERFVGWNRAGLLVLAMVAACVVNPAPGLFLTQPFGAEQRELVSRFTLEWRSPFDPALRAGAFHPYYEILLALGGLSIVASLKRFRLTAATLIVATALMSFQAHRFRVEFAMVSLPLMLLLLRESDWTAALRRRLRGTKILAAKLPLAAASVVLVVIVVGRVSVAGGVADRYPRSAFAFVRGEDIAKRPFHTIAFGSYLLWDLYGERKSFIDGRNFSPEVHRDFLLAQSNPRALRAVVKKYAVDSFIIPPVSRSDAGMKRIHETLVEAPGWSLVYVDGHAFVYVDDRSVSKDWLAGHRYTEYHPLTLTTRRRDAAQMRTLIEELRRAVRVAPDYTDGWADLGAVYRSTGDNAAAAAAFEEAVALSPNNRSLWNELGASALAAGDSEAATRAFETLVRLSPRHPAAWTGLGRARTAADHPREAADALSRAVEIDPGYADAYVALFELNARIRLWDKARVAANQLRLAAPADYRGYYFLAIANARLGDASNALTLARQAVQRNDRIAEIHVFIATLELQLKQTERAKMSVRRALAVDPNNAAALELKKRLGMRDEE